MTDRKSGSSEKDVKTAAKQISDKDIKVTLTQCLIVHVLENCLLKELKWVFQKRATSAKVSNLNNGYIFTHGNDDDSQKRIT